MVTFLGINDNFLGSGGQIMADLSLAPSKFGNCRRLFRCASIS